MPTERVTGRSHPSLLYRVTGTAFAGFLLLIQGCTNNPAMKSWHTEALTEEFAADMVGEQIRNLDDYLELEQKLFDQLDEKIYAKTPSGPEHALARYSRGSAADPTHRQPNWNRTFEHEVEAPVGGVLLLHGMSDSPYSLRALGEALNQSGYQVVGLRLPGHGTAPSGLRSVSWRDMAAAVQLAMAHLASELDSEPIHIIGYSTGAALALDFALEAVDRGDRPTPASLVLISPAIRVHAASALARFKSALSAVPGLGGMAYLSVMDEFDPYKYNSFATHAGAQVHSVTRDVDQRIGELAQDPVAAAKLPPILAVKSTVDSTVTTEAVVDNLLKRLPAHRNELLLFDINRHASIKSILLVADPAPLTERMMADTSLPFAVTFVTNERPQTRAVVARRKDSLSAEKSYKEPLGLEWPRSVASLSHVALPFPPDDPLYGQTPPDDDDQVFLGGLAITGERGLLRLPGDWLMRMRHNPFYPYLQTRVLEWLAAASSDSRARSAMPGES